MDSSLGLPYTSLNKTLLAGGCFWCIEAAVRNIPGVIEVFSGYAGGDAATATYQDSHRPSSGHREVVEVTYNPETTSYTELLKGFFKLIDPTDAGGQFADRGFLYTTAVYYQNDEEKSWAESLIRELDVSGVYDAPIATSIEPLVPFYPAEEAHQLYSQKNPDHYKAYYRGSGREAYVESRK